MVMYLGTFAVSFGLALYGDSLRKKKNMRGFALCMILAVLVGGMIAAVVCYEPLFLFLANIGLVSSRFAYYLNVSDVHFSLNPILVRLPFFLLVLFFYRDFAKEEKTEHSIFRKSDADFLVIMMIADMVTAELRIISVPIYRVSLYFSVFRCMAIGRVLQVLKKDPERKNWARLVAVGVVALLVVIWLYQVVLKGNDGIYPYTSRILHIGRETLI